MKYDWFIRFDRSFESNKCFIDYLRSQCDKILVYEHPAKEGKDVHCHGYISTDRTDETIRSQIKKQFNIKGFCQKPKGTLIQMIAYMSKGKYDPMLNVNIPDVDISNGKYLGYDKGDKERPEAGSDIDKKLEKVSRITMWSIANEAFAEYIFKIKELGYYIQGSSIQPWRTQIAYDIVLTTCHKYKKGHDNYVLQCLQTLSTFINPQSQYDRILSRFQ